MFHSLKWLCGIREVLGLPPLTDDALSVWDAALAGIDDAILVSILRAWVRSEKHFPLPAEIRALALKQQAAEQNADSRQGNAAAQADLSTTQENAMKHSEVIASIEGAIKNPMLLYSVGQLVIIDHHDPQTRYAGRQLPTGNYALAQVRIMVPLAAPDAA